MTNLPNTALRAHLPGPHRAFLDDGRAIVSLAAPLAATQLAQVAVSSLSVAILASLGPLELAGGGLAMMLFNLARTVGVGLVTGTANLVADADARDATRSRACLQTHHGHLARHNGASFGAPNLKTGPSIRSLAMAGFAIAAIAGTLFAVALLAIGPVLARFGQSTEVIAVAERYLKGAVLGLVPCLGFNVLRNVSVGLRRPGPVPVITLVSIGVHALVAIVLSRGLFGAPTLGALGIAISQTVTHLVTLIGIGWHVRCRAEIAGVSTATSIRADIKRTLALGVPTAAAYGSEAGFFAVVTLLVGSFGSTVLAAHNIVNQVVYIVFMLAVGVSHGTSVQVSRARGAGDAARVLRLGRVGFAIGAAVVLVVGAVEIIAPKLLLLPFASGATARAPEVMELAQRMLAVAVCFQLFDSMQNVAGALLRALHRPRITLLVTLVGYWCVGLPIAWLLGRAAGPLGIWWGLAAGLAATALLLFVVFERLASVRPQQPHLGLAGASDST